MSHRLRKPINQISELRDILFLTWGVKAYFQVLFSKETGIREPMIVFGRAPLTLSRRSSTASGILLIRSIGGGIAVTPSHKFPSLCPNKNLTFHQKPYLHNPTSPSLQSVKEGSLEPYDRVEITGWLLFNFFFLFGGHTWCSSGVTPGLIPGRHRVCIT